MSDCKVGDSVILVKINLDMKIKRRLYELGMLPKEVVKIVSISPLKNSFLIVVKNYTLAIRKNLLENIEVEEI